MIYVSNLLFLQPECTLSIYPIHGSQKGYVPLGQRENTSAHDRGGLCIAVQKNRLINSANITSAVFKDTIMAYRSARHAGAMDHPAFMAAMQAYEGHQLCDSKGGRMVSLMIQVAIERATGWFWKGVG